MLRKITTVSTGAAHTIPRIDRVGLQGDAMDIEVCTENPMLEEDIRLFYNVLGEDGELLGERFSVLARLLREMGY